jgi:UDP-N-acetylmuramoyl-tripeptide--D-alanyl-D-alanine ligase
MNTPTEILYDKFLGSGKIATDTRQITPGSVFFALKGPKYNANLFAAEALDKGASYAVVDEKEYVKNERILLVDDGLKALQLLAQHHRRQLSIPVLGLTGSNGKTTTKELLQVVLQKKYKTLSTAGNLNNHIGVPLTILSIDPGIELAVIEMGANHLGEIAALCEIAQPTHGLITNIGKAHMGTFGGFENIIRAKSELFQYLIDHEGQVFINSQNPILKNMAKRFKHPLFYPSAGDFSSCRFLSADPFVTLLAENGSTVTTHLLGEYNFENLAAALCVGKFFGVDPSLANQAISEFIPGKMRSEIVKAGSNTIILDAYNANPSSMNAAILNLSKMKADRKVAILGDMFELEGESKSEHRDLGKTLKESGIHEVYLCGQLIREALETFPAAMYFSSKEELMSSLKQNPIRNALILLKGSRGMQLESLLGALGD